MDIQSSSTSNSDIASADSAWRRFVTAAITALLLLSLLCYGFVLLLDPYDNLPYSPDLKRVPVDKLQRLFHPALARKAQFDSAVIGNSSIRLLRPAQLNSLLGGSFVNLGINAATSWEQQQIFNVFTRNHQHIENVIFGMDRLWCKDVFAEQKFIDTTTAADFPDWMYDERLDNNLPPLNLGSLKHAWRQFLAVSGISASKYGNDGYTVFTEPASEYNLDKARFKIYGSVNPQLQQPVNPPVTMTAKQRALIPISALNRLQTMLEALPAKSRKILLFVPYHRYYQAQPGSKDAIVWQECKQRVVELAAATDNAYVIDFMIRSGITNQDSNYWDLVHYTVEIAEQLGTLIGEAVNNRSENANYRLLHKPADPQ